MKYSKQREMIYNCIKDNPMHLTADAIYEMLKKENIRVQLDDRNEKLGYRLREAQTMKVPYTLILGDKEKEKKEMYNGNENIVVCDHPLIKHKITMLRNKETGTNEFRAIVEEIAMLMGYEALRDLELEEVEVETPIEVANCPVIAGKKPAIVPILRAGLGLVGGLLKLMPAAKIGHIGLYRDEETHEPHEYYCKLPAPIDQRKIFVVDPMLATGGSAVAAIDFIKQHGGKDITFMCVIAAPEGVEKLHKAHPDVKIFIGNLDRQLNENAYICPGLGDAGDRIFGTK